MSANIIELKNVKKTYRSAGGATTQALNGIDLTIKRGDFVAVMGPSGSGKSSLLHIMGLLDQKFEGTYRLDGENVSRLSNDQAAEIRGKKIGFVFQQFNLLRRTSVLQNVLLPTVYQPLPNAEFRALEVLKMVGLENYIESLGNELSGGQIQRVAIARALIMNPSLLLADEPTGNLDSKTAHQILEILREVNEQGTTVILITHERELARFAQYTIQLKDGLVEK
ncbi:MAG: ABC transporter ATP-binding protein [Actinobacteria bacterium]|nr:ABC transporter ATP-binding protein [Actinomycetota bacterium]